MTIRTIVKVFGPVTGGRWSVHGKGMQNLRVVRDDKVPATVRNGMGPDKIGFFYAEWSRSRGQWMIESVAPWQDWQMAHVRKGMLSKAPQWWKHLRDWKRVFWKKHRKDERRDVARQVKE